MPRLVMHAGESLLVADILEDWREQGRWLWVVRTIGGLTLTLSFDVTTLRWTLVRGEAAV